MPKTEIRSGQILDTSVSRADMNIATTGSAVITKVIAGTNVTIGSTGVDAGTGDVTINATGGSVSITETEVDFGATPVAEAIFVITDATMTAAKKIIATISYAAPTGKDQDEIEMDSFDIKAVAGTGNFTLYMKTTDGSYLADKFKINYMSA